MAQEPLVDSGLLIIESSRSHSETPQLIGFLWMSDQPDVGPLPDNTKHLQETDFHVPVGFEPPLPTRKRPQSHDLDLGANGTGY